MGIVDRFLEGGAAAAQDGDVAEHLLERLYGPHADVELEHVHLGDAVAEGAVDDAEEVGKVLGGDGAADVHRHQDPGVEAADRAHVLEAGPAVGTHAGQLALGREDAGAEARQDVAPVDPGPGGGLQHFGERAGEGAPLLGGLDDAVDEGDRHVVLVPELGEGGVGRRAAGKLLRPPVGLSLAVPLALSLAAFPVAVRPAFGGEQLLDAAGIPLVGLALRQVVIQGAVDLVVGEAVVVADGEVAAHGDGLLVAVFGLALVGVLEQDAHGLGPERLVEGRVAHLPQVGGVVLEPPLAGADGAGHRGVLRDVVGAEHLEQRRFRDGPALQELCDAFLHQWMLLT